MSTVLVFTETWLHADINSSEISSEYTLFRCDRSVSTSSHSRGGGVLIAVKNNIDCEFISTPNCQDLEQVAVCIKLQQRSFYIIAIYLPPNSSPELYSAHADAVQHVADLSAEHDVVLSIGDFNLPSLHWQLDCDANGYIPSNMSTDSERNLIENLFATGMHQINCFVNSNGKLLDLTFVTLPEYFDVILPSTPLLPIDIHHAPYILLLTEPNLESATPDDRDDGFTSDFQACDFGSLNDAFAAIAWDTVLANKSMDVVLSTFYDKINAAINDNVPKRKNRATSIFGKPWWTPELRNLRNSLRKTRKRYFQSKSDHDRIILREMEMSYKALLSSSYENYIQRIQSSVKQDPSSFWDFVKKQKSTNRIPTNVNHDGVSACTNSEAADLFATFFESVYSKASPVQRSNCFAHVPVWDIALPVLQFSINEVLEALEDLDTEKGAGTDGLPPIFFKNCSVTLALPISIIFNCSMRQRIFPAAWKMARIVPIYKSGNYNNVCNYRGISILCCISKVFETLVHKVLYRVASPFISETQHGFMKRRSTTSNLMCYTSALTREVEARRQVDSVYIDFAKAFDTVPHIIIVDKMKHMGFPDWFTEWIFSYLTSRDAFVAVNSARSRPFTITSGVPQGSVLGPLLFNIFLNDLCILISSCKLSFADDLKFYRIIATKSDCELLQEDIEGLLIWCDNNGMRVNDKKCCIISFTRRENPLHFQYTMGAYLLKRVQSICDLGVTINSKLGFNDHVGIITAKAFSTLGFIRRHAANFTDVYALKVLYCALVRSILEYAAPIWCPHYVTHILAIERVQRKFIRFALRDLPWRDPINLPHYPDRCQLIKLESLSARRINLQRIFIFDLITGNIDCPELLQQMPINVPPRRFRRSPLLAIPPHRTNYGVNNPFHFCLRSFNTVAEVFDFNVSKNVFKNRIRELD